MVELQDAAIFSGILLLAIGILVGTGALDFEGTNTSNIACDIPLANNFFSQCDTEVAEKYDLTTEITIQATDANAIFNEGSFEYSTTESDSFDAFSFIGPNSNLAFGGANDVTLNFQLINSNGEIVADGNKYIGELGILQAETINFDVDNLPTGDYTVKYGLSYTQDLGFFEGADYDKTLEKNIRIPKRIE